MKISLWTARAVDPQHLFKKHTVIASAAAGIGGLTQTKRLHLSPLGVRQNESVHAKLLSELESRTFQSVNPDSQQTLALQLLFLRASESMGNHDSNVVGAGRVG